MCTGAGAGGLAGGAAGTGLGTLSVTSAGTTAITLGKAGTALSYLGTGLLLGGAAMMFLQMCQMETHQKKQKTTYLVAQSIQ